MIPITILVKTMEIFTISIERIGERWIASIVPHENQFGSRTCNFNITNNLTSETFLQEIVVTEINDPPVIKLSEGYDLSRSQFSSIELHPEVEDEDEMEGLIFSINFEDPMYGQYGSILDQLPFHKPKKGTDWDFNNVTGYFFWDLSDQEIWGSNNGYVEVVEVRIILKVTDSRGASDTITWAQEMKDVNEEPQKPSEIHLEYYRNEIMVGDTVHFWVDEIIDPDDDRINYRWDFGDGATAQGMHVNHTYSKKGWKTIQMWVDDGEFQSEKISYRIEVNEEWVTDIPENPELPYNPESEENAYVFIIITIVVIVIIIIVVIMIFIVMMSTVEEREKMRRSSDERIY